MRRSGSRAKRAATGLVQIGLPTGTRSTGFEATRRDVLSLMGFSLGALGVGGCRAPVQHAVPLPAASTEMVPGVPNLYATTCGACSAGVQPGGQAARRTSDQDRGQRRVAADGRRDLRGGPGQRAVAVRRRAPARAGVAGEPGRRGPRSIGTSGPCWTGGDRDRRDVVLLSQTITSPSTLALLDELRAVFPKFRHVTYDPMSLAALREANRRCHGAAVVPHYRFDRARVVVALEADFLGTWLAPVEFARQWARRGAGSTGATAPSTCSASPASPSRAATRTCAWPSRRRRSGPSPWRCWPPSAVVSASARRAGGLAGAGRGGAARRRDRADRRGRSRAAAANRWSCRAATTWPRRSSSRS